MIRSDDSVAIRHKPVVHARRRLALQLDGGDVVFWPGYFRSSFASQLFDSLRSGTSVRWRQDDIVMFGRRVPQPRLTAWIADPGVTYRYSGLTLEPQDWPSPLDELRMRLATDLQTRLNSVLVNLYRNGDDAMGWHRDNETVLGPEPVIASLSLGETRFFDLRHRHYREKRLAVQRFELRSGDLIVMRGATQQNWHHRVPKQKARNGARINLSFRFTGSV